MARKLLLFIFLFGISMWGRSSHIMGGDITWTCQGGQYVFKLVFYRDCNGTVVNTGLETLKVWGHPTITTINMFYDSSTDVSPYCTQVPGSPVPLDCGAGPSGGNGIGAIEKAVYISDPITLTGTPPPSGWVFTFDIFSRSGAITNISNPLSYGITITAKMFEIPGSAGGCVDNSPQFLQEPYFVSCVGDAYEYNMNGIDPDLDSLSIFFGTPLDHLNGNPYNPPSVPQALPFEPGFSAASPTPGPGVSAGSVAAQIDPSSGNLTFLSTLTGGFTVKVVAQSFRNGVLIAEVMREIQISIVNCAGSNTAPDIAGPFGGLFETTVTAGTLVNFNLTATDVENLQDGTPQDNLLSATGPMFGTNYTNPATGCAVAPCATLDATPLITMSQGVTTEFNWQTTCDHLETPYGYTATSVPYHFVFKVQDNFCAVPKVSYATITINVENPGIVTPPRIDCIQTSAAGDVTINWSVPPDPLGTFTEYQLYSLQNGLIATIPNINTTSFTEVGTGGQQNDYVLATASGCNGTTIRYTDTVSNIFLDLSNPANGTAVLQWNDPINPPYATMGNYYHIYREYPAGTWTLYDSVPFGTHFYIDTITICDVWLNYQIVLPNQPCDFTSNIAGDQFEDKISPDIPVLYSVTIDSVTQEVTITWDQNDQADTYGYTIYVLDGGSIVELDQVFGIGDTSYTYSPDVTQGPLTYSVAAFDSCWTSTVPPTYQSSAKGDVHTTSFISSSLNICEQTVDLIWTDYVGWSTVQSYEIYGKYGGNAWQLYGNTADTTFLVDVIPGETYTFVVRGISPDGAETFTNWTTIYIQTPGQPAYNYLQVATVLNEEVVLRHHIDNSINVAQISIQKWIDGAFEEIERIAVTGTTVSYTDSDVNVNDQSYGYRVQVIDSCGRLGAISNEAHTVWLTIDNDDVLKENYLQWTPYYEFDGTVNFYNIYRGFDGVFGGAPIATVPTGQLSYIDDVNDVESNGRICYIIDAVESSNVFGFSEVSRSNEACVVLPPLIYIPNAFMPDGVNTIFKPVISDFDPENYDMTIFDRWGRVVFKTSDPYEGWDGVIQFSGEPATNDTFVYMVTVHDGNGIEIIKRGHVTLIR